MVCEGCAVSGSELGGGCEECAVSESELGGGV